MTTKEFILKILNNPIVNRRNIKFYFEWGKENKSYNLVAHVPWELYPELLISKSYLHLDSNSPKFQIEANERDFEKQILWEGLEKITKKLFDRINSPDYKRNED